MKFWPSGIWTCLCGHVNFKIHLPILILTCLWMSGNEITGPSWPGNPKMTEQCMDVSLCGCRLMDLYVVVFERFTQHTRSWETLIPSRVPCNGRAKAPRGYEPMMHRNGSGKRNRHIMHIAPLVKQASVEEIVLFPEGPHNDDDDIYSSLYRSYTPNSNTVDTKLHLIQTFFKIFATFLSFQY